MYFDAFYLFEVGWPPSLWSISRHPRDQFFKNLKYFFGFNLKSMACGEPNVKSFKELLNFVRCSLTLILLFNFQQSWPQIYLDIKHLQFSDLSDFFELFNFSLLLQLSLLIKTFSKISFECWFAIAPKMKINHKLNFLWKLERLKKNLSTSEANRKLLM